MSNTHDLRVSKSCANFHFWVNYPFKYNSDIEESVTDQDTFNCKSKRYFINQMLSWLFKAPNTLSTLTLNPLLNYIKHVTGK